MMAFEPHPQAEKRRSSAITLIKVLLANKKPEVLPAHYRELISMLLRKITEAESHKYKTRYQSRGARAIEGSGKGKLRHDHVYQRSKMIDELLEAKPEELDSILKNAIGCTVTIEEHSLLTAFDQEYGWDRYRKAGLVVVDTESGEPVF